MTNNKQSSVEWLYEKLFNCELNIFEWQKHLEQAKAMEKKQCVDFALKCMLNGLEPHQSTREVVERLFDEHFNNSDG